MMWIVRLCALSALCIFARTTDAFELRLDDDTLVSETQPMPPLAAPRLPVLFVHGHSFDAQDADNPTDDPGNPNYKKNWWDGNALLSLPSFRQTIRDPSNSAIGIEPYYIRFENQGRSITEDARDIEQVVDEIIRRHNPGFDTVTPSAPPPVQVVIIAFSKGTISTRQYLKSLQLPVQDPAPASGPRPPALNAPRPNYRPVSDFIAISPPNHGVAFPGSRDTTQLSVKQLHDGVKAANLIGLGCGESYNDPQATGFVSTLNGHPVADTINVASPIFPSEAPGFRRDGEGPHRGTLYVTLYAANNADAVGGDDPSGDCAGRVVARNLAGDASGLIANNVASTEVVGIGPLTTHANTVHTRDVICKALFAAVHHRSLATENCAPGGAVPTIRLPERTAAMLALDISGSMSLPACPTCAASRLDVLKDSVELFVQLWSMLGRPDDRLGVTYFNTQVTQHAINGDTLPTLANANAIVSDVRAKSPANLTAMGGALQRSVETLRALPAGAAARRHIILFTDGMQNVNPMVREVSASPPQHDIGNEPGRPDSGVPPAAQPLRIDTLSDTTDALPDISVDTIGVGTGQAFLDLLADIAAESSGRTHSTVNAEDLRQFFVEELIETLRGFSPQLVGYRRGTLTQHGASETFPVNKAARKLLLKVSWPRGQKLSARVLKDGADVTASARIASGSFYRIFAFDRPTGLPGALAGEWGLHIAGTSGIAYEAAAIIDEPELRYRTRLGSARNDVDAPLTLSVDVRAGKRPIDGPVEVTASVARPGVAVGNLLASSSDAGMREPEPGMAPAERRLAALAVDPKRWKDLQPRVEMVRLKGDGKGGFRVAMPNVRIPGLYRATVRIRGRDRELGPFERSETAIAIVRFRMADRAKSEIVLRDAAKEKALGLTLRPRDRHGNLLGPGLAKEIKLTMSSGQIQSGPDDLGDGRYSFQLSRFEGQNASIALTVAGHPLFKGRLDAMRAAPRRR